MNLKNPFLIRGYCGSKYFCDREKETAELVSALLNERDVTLMSPRRYGKTGLIQNAFERLKGEVSTIYIDIFSTETLADFTRLFASAVVGALDSGPRKIMKAVGMFFTHCRPTVTPQETGLPKFSFDLTTETAEATLKDAFEYLKAQERRVVIALDEFQQILEYPERGTEALLRSQIQFLPNVHFIFAGSRRHLMRDMFMTPRHPFYQSSDVLNLDVIPSDAYASFAGRFFAQARRRFDPDVFALLYQRFGGVTWYVQMVLNRVWQSGRGLDAASAVAEAVDAIVSLREFEYSDLLRSQNDASRKLLRAVAAEGRVAEPLAGAFLQRHGLGSASTVRSALKVLLNHDLLYRDGKDYIVYERFFAEWLKR